MATWLAYLKSKLFYLKKIKMILKLSEVAEKLKLQLKKLELIRILSDQMLQKRLGVHIYTRGMKGGINLLILLFTTFPYMNYLKPILIFKCKKLFKI